MTRDSLPSETARLWAVVEMIPLPSQVPSPMPPTGTFLPALSKLRTEVNVVCGLGPPATISLLSVRSSFAPAAMVTELVLITLELPAVTSALALFCTDRDDDVVREWLRTSLPAFTVVAPV